VEYATSYFRYQAGSRFQSIIHDLKYRDRKEIGREFGRLLGQELAGSGFCTADMILPVPLNRRKQLKRGYNQCDPICVGMSDRLDIPFYSNLLDRPRGSGSQTDKSRIGRWKNVSGDFRVRFPGKIRGKHVLLADDVITTGSTLEACANAILEIEGTRISIATLAVTLKTF
jgi:ComF family protein